MKWEMRVNPHTVTTRLRVRTGPSTSYRIVNWKYPNQGANVVDSKVTAGATWYKWEGTEYWSCGRTSNGTDYLLKMRDLEEKPEVKPSPEPKPEPKDPGYDIPTPNLEHRISDVSFNNNGKFNGTDTWYVPMTFTKGFYDVPTDDQIAQNIAKLKYNMDISYAYKNNVYLSTIDNGYFSDLQKKLYNSFNRNKTNYPDKALPKTFAYVFFTRPDLNILKRESNTTNFTLNNENVGCDPKYKYIWRNNPWCMKSLVSDGNPYHKFMVLLSNEALSFEVEDVVLKTIEHGETYNGNKIVYGKSDQESNAAGEMSIRYIDTIHLDIYKTHLVWTDYINKVSRGIFKPKTGYMKNRIIDYAASCYYFLCGPDGSTILYWQKLTGVFPVNTGENAFSWDSGTLLAKPEINIKYMYSFKSVMDMFSIYEFNELAAKSSKYKAMLDGEDVINGKKGDYGIQTGSTLTHSPRVFPTKDTEGNMIFRLVWVEK
jgi:hypothetical protein